MNFIGIDLGATKIKAGIISECGKIIDRITVDTPVGGEINTVVDSICILIDKLLKTDSETTRCTKDIDTGIPVMKGAGVRKPSIKNTGVKIRNPETFWK